MIHHIVMFKLLDTRPIEQQEQNKREMKKRLEALPGKIEVIRSMQVGINVKESERAFDVVLVSTFDNLDDLKTYSVHPAHQEFVSYVAEIREKVASVDYEV
jgi:acyl-CoA-binding protein